MEDDMFLIPSLLSNLAAGLCRSCQSSVLEMDNGSLNGTIFIGPEPDHWLPLSLTDSLTDSCLLDLIGVTLACEDAYSKLVEVATIADISDEDRVGNNLLQIWKLRFGHKAYFLFRL